MTLFELAKTIPITQIIENLRGMEHAHQKSGRTVIPCPFHSDSTASFTLYENTNSFYCFGCGQGGDGIKFVEKLCNLSPKNAALLVCKIGGIPVEDTGPHRGSKLQESMQQIEKDKEIRKFERALTEWADTAYVKLCAFRRAHWIILQGFEDLRSDWQTRLEYLDYLLDFLQYGSLRDKLSVNRATRHGELGFVGAWLNGL